MHLHLELVKLFGDLKLTLFCYVCAVFASLSVFSMHCKRNVYLPPDTHIWVETVILWPFVLFSTPSCNVSLQRQTEAHLSRLIHSQVQTVLLQNYSTHTFPFSFSLSTKWFIYLLLFPNFMCFVPHTFLLYFLFHIGNWKSFFSSGYGLHAVLPPIAKSLNLKSWFTNHSFSLTKTDLNVRAPLRLPSGPLKSADLILPLSHCRQSFYMWLF